MKVNAPEKIYLTKNLLGELRDGWDALPSEVFTNIEYIRKDDFIEKTKKWLYLQLNEINMEGEDMENFLKDFKKYMEE